MNYKKSIRNIAIGLFVFLAIGVAATFVGLGQPVVMAFLVLSMVVGSWFLGLVTLLGYRRFMSEEEPETAVEETL